VRPFQSDAIPSVVFEGVVGHDVIARIGVEHDAIVVVFAEVVLNSPVRHVLQFDSVVTWCSPTYVSVLDHAVADHEIGGRVPYLDPMSVLRAYDPVLYYVWIKFCSRPATVHPFLGDEVVVAYNKDWATNGGWCRDHVRLCSVVVRCSAEL